MGKNISFLDIAATVFLLFVLACLQLIVLPSLFKELSSKKPGSYLSPLDPSL